jgi:hypothetical protein
MWEAGCQCCGTKFLTKSHKAKTCGYQCREVLRTRPSNVVYLTHEIFDGWFKRAA